MTLGNRVFINWLWLEWFHLTCYWWDPIKLKAGRCMSRLADSVARVRERNLVLRVKP